MRSTRIWSAAAAILALGLALQACDDSTTTTTEPMRFTLAVGLQGLGDGSVSSEPVGIACDTTGAACTAEFEEGTVVTLTPTPAEGSEFVAWTGDGTGTGALTVTMDADRSVTAEFDNPDMVAQAVGSGGGTAQSTDGTLSLVIPAGALAADEVITVEVLDPAALGEAWDEVVAGGDIRSAYDLGPDGLVFDKPVAVEFTPRTVSTEGDSMRVEVPELMTAQDGTPVSVDSAEVAANFATGETRTRGFLHHFSPLVEPATTNIVTWSAPSEALVEELFEVVLDVENVDGSSVDDRWVTQDVSGPISHLFIDDGYFLDTMYLSYVCTGPGTATITIAFTMVMTDGSVRVAILDHTVTCVGHTLNVTTSGEGTGTVRDGAGHIECGSQGSSCSHAYSPNSEPAITLTATPDEGMVFAGWTVDGEPFTGDGEGNATITMDADRTVDARFEPMPTVHDLGGLSVQALEALSFIWPDHPFGEPSSDLAMLTAGETCPTVLVAGDGGALAVDACDGGLVQQFDFALSFYDAHALPRPEGETGDHAIFATGQGYAFFWVDDSGAVTSQIGQLHWGTVPDAAPINGDAADGVALIRDDGFGQMVYFVRYDPVDGYHKLLPDFVGVTTTPPNAQSVFASGLPDDPLGMPEEMLVVGNTSSEGVLYHIETVSETDPTWTEVGNLGGNNPRRIRCDLASGICAVSDFQNSLVTIVLWDGTGMPTIAGTTTAGQIASGPVGLDVFGNYIVTAGFNDDSYSIIEVNGSGTVVNATTAALPDGCSAPGHAVFLGDGGNTVLVSCNGTPAIARIPAAF